VRVARRLALWGVPSTALVLELTETAVMSHPQRCQEVMRELRRLHVGLSLDDYGTGYASLAYLTTMPVDELKIDKSFVLGMADNRVDRSRSARPSSWRARSDCGSSRRAWRTASAPRCSPRGAVRRRRAGTTADPCRRRRSCST
jgi:hypothetical protein